MEALLSKFKILLNCVGQLLYGRKGREDLLSLWGSVEPLREDTRGLRRSGVIYITMKTLSLTSLAPPKDTYSWPVYKLRVISMAMLEQKPVSAPGTLEEERLTTLVLHFWKNLLYTNSHWHALIKNVECLCILNVFWIILE